VFEPAGAEEALALAELGWGLLFASDVGESVDLTLAARRAAEDSGTPFLVVHDLLRVRHAALPAALDPSVITSFIGPAETRVRRIGDAGHPVHVQLGARAFAERVPFALGSALRELEGLTGRKCDVVTRSPVGEGADAPLVLVGLGALGDRALGAVPRLRAAGHDVGAMKVTAFRPFPGPRVVRTLARALAVTVLEHQDAPLAQSNLLTREVKSAFADAITWAPEYPGVGRVPRIHSGVARPSSPDLAPDDVDAVVRNMLAGDQGKRLFVLGGDAVHDLDGRSSRDDAARGSVRG
jgi:pyruvate/2-oxoacid:ferredoxin oxidoreductase alpha subunit